MMAIIKIFESPAIAIIPKRERIQIRINTTAICLNGLGNAPINQIKTKKINMSHKLIERPLNFKRVI